MQPAPHGIAINGISCCLLGTPNECSWLSKVYIRMHWKFCWSFEYWSWLLAAFERLLALQDGGTAALPTSRADKLPQASPPAAESAHADAVLLQVAKTVPKVIPHILINARVGESFCLQSLE